MTEKARVPEVATWNFRDWHTVVGEVDMELGGEDNDGLSQRACTALAEE